MKIFVRANFKNLRTTDNEREPDRPMIEELSNLKIWIIGASRGIGAAIARNLSETGATLFLGSRSADSLKNIADELSEKGNVFAFPGDASDEAQAAKTYDKIKAVFGAPDVVINNAGIGIFKNLVDIDYEEFDRMIAVNLKGVFIACKTALPDMIERRKGIIININSISAKTTFVNSSVYSATKAGALAMSRALREEIRDKGVKIVDIFPGATNTDIWKPELREQYSDRMIKPEDIAETVRKALELSTIDGMMIEEIDVRPQGGDL